MKETPVSIAYQCMPTAPMVLIIDGDKRNVLSRNLPTSSMVMKDVELGPLCSCSPPSHAQSSIEAT